MRNWYLNCGKCGNNFSVSEGYEGMYVKCRDCGKRIYIQDRRKILFWWKVGIIAVIVIAGCVYFGIGAFILSAIIFWYLFKS